MIFVIVENWLLVIDMEKDCRFGEMERFILDNGSIIKQRVLANSSILTQILTSEIFLMTELLDSVSISIQMELFMKVIGSMTFKVD